MAGPIARSLIFSAWFVGCGFGPNDKTENNQVEDQGNIEAATKENEGAEAADDSALMQLSATAGKKILFLCSCTDIDIAPQCDARIAELKKQGNTVDKFCLDQQPLSDLAKLMKDPALIVLFLMRMNIFTKLYLLFLSDENNGKCRDHDERSSVQICLMKLNVRHKFQTSWVLKKRL